MWQPNFEHSTSDKQERFYSHLHRACPPADRLLDHATGEMPNRLRRLLEAPTSRRMFTKPAFQRKPARRATISRRD